MSLESVEDLSYHLKFVGYIVRHLKNYMLSFRWENRGKKTTEDMAALISAVGWCSGWKTLFSIMPINPTKEELL